MRAIHPPERLFCPILLTAVPVENLHSLNNGFRCRTMGVSRGHSTITNGSNVLGLRGLGLRLSDTGVV